MSAPVWYGSQRENLGAKFLDRVDEALEVIEGNPEGPQQIMPNLRHLHLKKFEPVSLWYTVVNEVPVLAFMHGKGRLGPFVWRRYKGLKP